MIVDLREAVDRERFGGKAAQLAASLVAGLPVPGGLALSVEAAQRIARGDDRLPALDEGTWAVRSSAADEDGTAASFAGQHVTHLHVTTAQLAAAVADVVASGATASARAYRERLGLAPQARMGVVVQRMVPAATAGVLFTRNPTSGADELVVEAAWGLGEAVVGGLVVPDHWRLSTDGRVLASRPGEKDLEIVADEAGGTVERTVPAARIHAPCLTTDALARLVELARALDRVFDGPHDAEFAFDAADRLYLLQRRGLTT